VIGVTPLRKWESAVKEAVALVRAVAVNAAHHLEAELLKEILRHALAVGLTLDGAPVRRDGLTSALDVARGL
jgi:hypothetical protein